MRRFTALAPAAWKRHPLQIRATLRDCVTLTYAVPAAVLRPLIPPGLELDSVGDLGFVAPQPVNADVRRVGFFDQPAFAGCTPRLAGAFHVRDVEYHWLRGVRHAL